MKSKSKKAFAFLLSVFILFIGISSCDGFGLIELSPKDVNLSGEAHNITFKASNKITSLFVKVGESRLEKIYAPASEKIEGEWYVISYDSNNKKTIYVTLTENLTPELRSLTIIANRYGYSDRATITQQPL